MNFTLNSFCATIDIEPQGISVMILECAFGGLLAFAMAETAYLPLSFCPEVLFKSSREMCILGTGSPKCNSPEHGRISNDGRTVYILESISPDTVCGKSYIVHEFVHLLQRAIATSARDSLSAGPVSYSRNRLEREAYQVQSAFLNKKGYLWFGRFGPDCD